MRTTAQQIHERGARRSRAAPWIALAALLAAAGCSGPQPINVVVFLIDTLRADHLGAYGAGATLSPRFDALAERAVLFEQAYAPAPWTLPSAVSILTSTLPCEHRVLLDGDRVPDELEPLAERLRRTGRATASFFANPYAGPMTGLDRGFDRAELVPFEGGARVAKWLEGLEGRPFFLYVHNVEPHDPYTAPAPGVPDPARARTNRLVQRYRALTRLDWSHGRPVGTTDNAAAQEIALSRLAALRPTLEALYAADVRLADARLGSVVDALERHAAWDRTLLVVLSDHGEAFGEHGGFQHDQSLYEELLRVPLLVRLPGDAHAGRRVSTPVSLLDVLPTIAEVLDEPEVARGSRGRSLLAHLESADDSPIAPRVVALRSNHKKHYARFGALRGDLNVALREGPWKAIWNQDPGTLELYDLRRDPDERVDRSAAEPERAHALRLVGRAAAGRCARRNAEPSAPDATLDADTRERLRSLGYLDSPP